MPTAKASSNISVDITVEEQAGGSMATSRNSSSRWSKRQSSPSNPSDAPTTYLSETGKKKGGDSILRDLLGDIVSFFGDLFSGFGSGETGDGILSWIGSGGADSSSSDTAQFAGDASGSGSVEPGKKPVVIISHGMGANGMSMSALARQFEEAGYHVETPTDLLSPFDGSGAVDAYNRLAAQNNPELDLDNVILVGHSAGGAAAQRASRQLGDKVAGVITIDSAPSLGGTNTDVPHANFRHSGDILRPLVGNPNPTVSADLLSDETSSGGHLMAMTGLDAEIYIEAADQMLGR
jgi:pimeloyl-ACP methyl ester carboxylesterase